MPPLAQLIADRFLGQQVNILRLSSSERDKVFAMLGTLQARLLATMDQQIPLPGFGSFTKERLNALYRLTDKLIQQQYDQINSLHDNTLVDVSGFQGRQAQKLVNAVVGVPLMSVGVPIAVMKALVNDDLVDGRPAAYWWDQQATTLKSRYRDEIRQGVFAGETLGQLKQRIRGTKALNFQDGIMALTSRNADALIRTSLLSVANAARYETLKANDDVLDGQQWLATLDDRTCPICQALDGQTWDFDGTQLGDTTQDFPGPPPEHFNCRCTLVPLLKSWAQLQRDAGKDDALGKKLDKIEGDLGPGTRASMDGQVSAKMTYEEWLKQQDVATQKDILGPRRWDLWDKGLVNAQDMVDQKNRPLTLDQIKAKAQVEFDKGLQVGLDQAAKDAAEALRQQAIADAAEQARLDNASPPTTSSGEEQKAAQADREAEMSKLGPISGTGSTIDSMGIKSVVGNGDSASSESYVITFEDGRRAMFKPKIGESESLRRTIDAGTYYQREAVAYEIAKIMKLDDLVPETVIRTINGEIGSVQAFAEGATVAAKLPPGEELYGSSQLDIQRASFFDAIMGNTDRHMGNWMIDDETQKLVLIDHGLTLPYKAQHLRINLINGLDNLRAEIPESIKASWEKNWPEIKQAMKDAGIEPDAITLAKKRLDFFTQPHRTWKQLEQKVDFT